ncbi:MAG: HEAT repeat domain-containing protein [Candidatus Hodarchaeales archaeon]
MTSSFSDFQFLSQVISSLGKFESDAVAEALLPFFNHPNTIIAGQAGLSALSTQKQAIIPEIKKLLQRESAHYLIQFYVALGLGKRRDSESLKLLLDIAMDQGLPAVFPRAAAVTAFRQIGEFASKRERAELIASLQKLLHDENAPHVRLRVLSAITLSILHAVESRRAIESLKSRVPLIFRPFIQEYLDKMGEETVPKELKQLREDLEEIRKENGLLKDRLAKLEAKINEQ